MHNTIERYSERHRDEALADLRSELSEFSHDGLVQLREDLGRNAVVRGSWAGCVISYKRGAPGSARRDRLGRARNAFTVLWDNGWLSDDDVIALVDLELARRRAADTGREHTARPPAIVEPGIAADRFPLAPGGGLHARAA